MWVSLGLDPDSFWSKTPALIAVIVAGANDRLLREHNQLAWGVWHTAALMRVPPEKRIPKLDRLLAKPAQRTRQSWREQMAIMDMWAAVKKRAAAQKRKDK